MVRESSVLIVGAGGQLGTAVARLMPGATTIHRADLDLADADLGSRFRDLLQVVNPAAVVNCAAYTNVDRAESDERLASVVNGQAVGVLAEVTGSRRVPFVTYSSDYVFDGRQRRPYLESDRPSPVNAYGRSKRQGELLALAANPMAAIIRTSWIVSGTHPNFVATILHVAKQGRVASVVADQRGCPTMADDLAAATTKVLGKGAEGVLHLTNRGETTWYELARVAVVMAGLDGALVEPCATADYPTAAPRPQYSVLGSEHAPALEIELPDWRDSLPQVVREILAKSVSSTP